MGELEYLDTINQKARDVFYLAVAARGEAQAVIEATQSLMAELQRRKIELQRALLAEAEGGNSQHQETK